MKYFKLFKSSLKSLKKNPIIILPDLFFFLVAYLMAILFYKTSGLDSFLKKTILANAIEIQKFNQFVTSNWFGLLVSGLVFIIVTFLVGIGIDIIRYRLLKRIVLRKRLNFFKTIFSKNPYFVRVFFMKVYVYLINLFLIIVATSMIAIIYQTPNSILYIIAKLFILLLGIGLILCIKLSLTYRYAVLFLDNERRAFRGLKRSLKLFLEHTKQVFIVWFILVVFGFTVWLLLSLIGSTANYLQQFTSNTNSYMFLSFVSISLINLIRISYKVFEELYVFKTYSPIKKS